MNTSVACSVLPLGEVGEAGVQHLRDRGELLHRPVVEQLGDPAALLLLGQHALREERSLRLVHG